MWILLLLPVGFALGLLAARCRPLDRFLRPCRCRWLSERASEPSSHIQFNREMREHYLVVELPDGWTWRHMLYYCPSCGGRAPESHRERMFAKVFTGENNRLIELLKDARTEDDVRARVGPPQDEGFSLAGQEPLWERGTVEGVKTMTYTELSTTGNLIVSVNRSGTVLNMYVSGKYLGPPPG